MTMNGLRIQPVERTARIRVASPAAIPTVTVIPGDGVGAEVVEAALRVLDAAGARIRWEYADAGERVARRGVPGGVPGEALDALDRTGLVLCGPLGTRAATTLREAARVYAGLRFARALPGVAAPLGARPVDLVVASGPAAAYPAEHRPAPGVVETVRLLDEAACARTARVAFRLAASQGRSLVHCASPAGALAAEAMRRAFEAAAAEHPGISAASSPVGEVAGRLVRAPEAFGVILAEGTDAETLGWVAAGLVGGAEFVPQLHLGEWGVLFSPSHGALPDLAGRGTANPSATLLAAVLLLRHLGQHEAAGRIEHALAATLDQGVRTAEIPGRTPALSTGAFADAVAANLGRRVPGWEVRPYEPLFLPPEPRVGECRQCPTGIAVLVEAPGTRREVMERLASAGSRAGLRLEADAAACTPAGPEGFWWARFVPLHAGGLEGGEMLSLLARIGAPDRWVHARPVYAPGGAA